MKFEKEVKQERREAVPIRFIGKSGQNRGEDVARVRQAQESPAYRPALEMVHEAMGMRVTDIHMEPTKEEMSVRYRIDGILQAASPFDRAERRRHPQHLQGAGRSRHHREAAGSGRQLLRRAAGGARAAAGRSISAWPRPAAWPARRWSCVCWTARGPINDLTRLGMRDRLRDQVRAVVTQPHGMFIVCGPTGSGKSTTLYACLSEIDCFQKNVITVENPVEYHMPNVTQIEINVKAGKTFASELRSILRQDPDVIYIGEIRDQETAEIACQAAQTGHMVFTTLHANDTVTALGRLIELGVKPFMVANSVSAILGQRLVRVLCPKCKVAYRPNPEMLRKLNLPADKIKSFYRPPKPEDAGEDGRSRASTAAAPATAAGRASIELLTITDKIRDMFKENPNFDAIRQEAVKSGVTLLSQDGLRLVIEGETSIEELLRVSK